MSRSMEAVIAALIGVIIFNVVKVVWENKQSGKR